MLRQELGGRGHGQKALFPSNRYQDGSTVKISAAWPL